MSEKSSIPMNDDMSEVVRYNNPLFPAYITDGCLSVYPDFAAPSHWHDDLEFIVLQEGAMSYNVNGIVVDIEKGDGLFVNSRHLHYGFSPNHEEGVFVCILLNPSLLSSNDYFAQKFVRPFLDDERCPYVNLNHCVPWTNEVLELLNEIYFKREDEFSQFVTQKNFFRIMELLYANNRPVAISKEKSRDSLKLDVLKKMILFVQENSTRKISLEQIAESGACCKSKCSALFREFVKDSPVNFLIKYRLQKSCNFLRNTQNSIIDIAFDCGFGNPSYYCKMFRKFYGITPQEYRKNVGL